MVDVNVDVKQMAKAPVDPASVIPESVTKRAAAVSSFYDANGKRPHDVETNPEEPGFIRITESSPAVPVTQQPRAEAPEVPQTPLAVVSPPQPTAPASADQIPQPHADSGDESPENWKHRYLAMQGRYTAAQKLVGEQEELMRQMGRELVQAQHRPPPPPPPQRQAPPPQQQVNYLTERDVENYGTELIDLAQRAAAQVVAPQVQQIHEENARLREQLARESRRALDQAVAMAVPNFREVDRNPRWHQWLLGLDVFSSRVRQTLLNEAISAADAPRVVSFFRGFLNEEAATGHSEPAPVARQATPPRAPAVDLGSLAAPGRARPASGGDASLPPDKPVYSRADITRLYDQHRRGAYVGREAEWARQEADIIAAGREQRIR